MFKPFSKRASAWEPVAMELRQMLRLRIGDLLDPWQLAPHVRLAVVNAKDFLDRLPDESRDDLIGDGSRCWSGGVLPLPLPDGRLVCILNPLHCVERQRITLMEEICHIHLAHQPSTLTFDGKGTKVRGFDKRQEDDAYGVGAAALLPWGSFYSCLNKGATYEEIAEMYKVSRALVEYRTKICGATRLYRSRRQTPTHR